MLASAAWSIYNIQHRQGPDATQTTRNYRAAGIVCWGTGLALLILIFSRRYLHGEDMFVRLQLLSLALVAGFNLVASSPLYHIPGENV